MVSGSDPPSRRSPSCRCAELTADEAAAVRNGRSVPGTELGLHRLLAGGDLVAVAHGDGDVLRPETVLP